MQIEIPIFRQISRDLSLPPRAFQVWRSAIEFLDVVDWRELKQMAIELELDVDQSTVSRALAVLVDRGYLCKLAEIGAQPRYRVPLSRVDPVAPSTPPAASESVVTTHLTSRRTRARVVSNGVV
ncbi:hypothetical protein [Gemmatimonas sp.]|uniref:hypothetical protein n=1 Tax=Gemmatimonas sp. TaxID=1962908 RepID=UPI0025C54DCF|nr:hypothetical protein [Gemmatimonas sp.]MCA2991047.1 hypothetical protein [Gemmatimonas sp.]